MPIHPSNYASDKSSIAKKLEKNTELVAELRAGKLYYRYALYYNINYTIGMQLI